MPADPTVPLSTLHRLPRPTREAVLRFQRNGHVRREAINTPPGANGMCAWASAVFAGMCPTAEPVNVQGSRVNFTDPDPGDQGGIEWRSRVGHWQGACHTVVRVGHWYLDWTARQFDAAAPWPLAMTERELRQRWMRVGRNAE